MQTYEVGGKGRKPCPHCNKYVAARVTVCECGYSFEEGIVAAKKESQDGRHSSGGRGLRQCGGCGLYVSVKTPICPCGHVFEKVVKSEQVIPTFTEGGRGKKLCPGCGLYVGARVLTCVCGHDFHAVVKEEVAVPSTTEPKPATVARPSMERDNRGNRYQVIAIPSGKCPIKLTSTAEDVVIAWAQSVQDYGRSRMRTYSTSALRYWVRDYYDIGTSEHKEVCAVLGEMFLRQSA